MFAQKISEGIGMHLTCIFPSFQHDYTYPHYWEVACKAQWWPFDDGTCNQMRCTACAPSIMSAAAVCRAREQTLAYKCMQGVSTYTTT